MTWLRTNRWWLPVLPLCVLGMLAASSYRVRDFWYDAGLHHRVAAAEPGKALTATLDFDDRYGATSRSFTVRLVGITSGGKMPPGITDFEPQPPPKGDQVLLATLAWSAARDQSLTNCQVALVGADGARYQPTGDAGQADPCVPRRAGPYVPFSKGDRRGVADEGDQRPGSWSTKVRVLAPDGVRITKVLIWWSKPDYVELPVA